MYCVLVDIHSLMFHVCILKRNTKRKRRGGEGRVYAQ